jgi:hypothetical protein
MTHNPYELSLFTRFLLWLLSTRPDVVKVNVGSPVNYLERCYSNSAK